MPSKIQLDLGKPGHEAVIFSYSVTHLPPSMKVRAVYALKGRGEEKGLVEEYGGKWIANACFATPVRHEKDIIEVLELWKVRYQRSKVRIIG